MNPLTAQQKQRILTNIWGLEEYDRRIPLETYFEHYYHEVGDNVPHAEFSWVLYFVDLLKMHPNLSIIELCAVVTEHAKDTTVTGRSNTTIPPYLIASVKSGGFDIGVAFVTAVRIMLAINLAISGQEGDDWGGLEIHWEGSKSLIEILQEVIPVHTMHQETSSPIKGSKLSARYLTSQAEIELIWTTNLADHLLLDMSGGKKTLHVFHMVSLLELSYYESLDGQDQDLSLEQSLRRYAL